MQIFFDNGQIILLIVFCVVSTRQAAASGAAKHCHKYWLALISQFSQQYRLLSVFPNLVIYHELRDFGVSLRDRNFPSVRSHESPKSPWFWDISLILGYFPKNWGKFPMFDQKVIFFVKKYSKFYSKIQTKTFSKKYTDFSRRDTFSLSFLQDFFSKHENFFQFFYFLKNINA